jgi:hypothetical protein
MKALLKLSLMLTLIVAGKFVKQTSQQPNLMRRAAIATPVRGVESYFTRQVNLAKPVVEHRAQTTSTAAERLSIN